MTRRRTTKSSGAVSWGARSNFLATTLFWYSHWEREQGGSSEPPTKKIGDVGDAIRLARAESVLQKIVVRIACRLGSS